MPHLSVTRHRVSVQSLTSLDIHHIHVPIGRPTEYLIGTDWVWTAGCDCDHAVSHCFGQVLILRHGIQLLQVHGGLHSHW